MQIILIVALIGAALSITHYLMCLAFHFLEASKNARKYPIRYNQPKLNGGAILLFCFARGIIGLFFGAVLGSIGLFFSGLDF